MQSPQEYYKHDGPMSALGAHADEIRALPNGYANSRAGKALVEALRNALDNPPPDGTPPESRRRGREPSPAALDLLKTLLRIRAHDYGVAARLVASGRAHRAPR